MQEGTTMGKRAIKRVAKIIAGNLAFYLAGEGLDDLARLDTENPELRRLVAHWSMTQAGKALTGDEIDAVLNGALDMI